MDIDEVEKKALKLGIFISLLMAVAGWITYYFSGSDAMLLDGNFSFISVFAGLVALIISNRKHRKTKTFPFGSYVYEALFVLIKGILILGVILVSGLQNTLKIIAYLKGKRFESVVIEPILIYVIIISILCFVLYFFYKSKNKTIDNKSSILQVETKASLVDGFLSLGIGLVFMIIWLLPANSSFDFLKSIGDAIIVLIMCLVFFTLPLTIIKESFIELGGGIMQDTATKEMAEKAITESLPPNLIKQSIYISKLGSSYFILVYVSSDTNIIDLSTIETLRKKIQQVLIHAFTNVKLEIIVSSN
ncbi:MAG: cation transporter [Bacteroidales bacterium]|nr:cation transporter [Bacteroidales bacterium]